MALNGVVSLNTADKVYIRELEKVIDDLQKRLNSVEQTAKSTARKI